MTYDEFRRIMEAMQHLANTAMVEPETFKAVKAAMVSLYGEIGGPEMLLDEDYE